MVTKKHPRHPDHKPHMEHPDYQCTMWPDGRYNSCCVEHDIAYMKGGTWRERREADKALFHCVREHSNLFNACLMYVGVRIAGSSLWPFRS